MPRSNQAVGVLGKVLIWGKKGGGWLGCRPGPTAQWVLFAAGLVLVSEEFMWKEAGVFAWH